MCFARPKAPKIQQVQAPVVQPKPETTEFAFNPLAIQRSASIDQLRDTQNPLQIQKKKNTNNNIGL